MTSSGMTHAGAWGVKNKYRVEGSYTGKKNFGSLEIDWKDEGSPSLIMRVHHHDGSVFKMVDVTFE